MLFVKLYSEGLNYKFDLVITNTIMIRLPKRTFYKSDVRYPLKEDECKKDLGDNGKLDREIGFD